MPRISLFIFLFVCALSSVASRAQAPAAAQVSKVFAVLSTSIDSKTAARGDEVVFTTMNDLTINGKLIIPKGSKLVGHISSVANRGKDGVKSAVAIIIDKAVVDQTEIPLKAIVAAIAAPREADTAKRSGLGTRIENAHDQTLLLKEDSAGAIGYQGVSIAWNLTVPPPATIFAINAKSLKLLSGTQMLLRMLPPESVK